MSGMIKLFSGASDWGRLPQVGMHQIKVASGGLSPNDRRDAESFADPELLHRLSRLNVNPDCVYVHKVAMGCSDFYGPNRWGDGFRAEILKRDCPTFETHAKAYRMHQSEGDFYGKPKLAWFNPKSGVVELVTEYYGTDKVASANGGKVADKEIESLLADGAIPVSMGSRVPGDRCIICQNWAPKRAYYCTSKSEGGKCELFGCKYGMLKVAKDGRQNYVDNPTNLFYDISMVDTGADPIAFGLPLPIGKLASASGMLSLRDLMELDSFDVKQAAVAEAELHQPFRREMLYLASRWELLEQKLANYQVDSSLDSGLIWDASEAFPISDMVSPHEFKRANCLKMLAYQDVLPSFNQYATAYGCSPGQIESLRGDVPDLFTRLKRAGLTMAAVKLAPIPKNFSANLVPAKIASINESCSRAVVVRRALERNASALEVKLAARNKLDRPVADVLVRYAAAKLAWAAMHPEFDDWRFAALARRELVQF